MEISKTISNGEYLHQVLPYQEYLTKSDFDWDYFRVHQSAYRQGWESSHPFGEFRLSLRMQNPNFVLALAVAASAPASEYLHFNLTRIGSSVGIWISKWLTFVLTVAFSVFLPYTFRSSPSTVPTFFRESRPILNLHRNTHCGYSKCPTFVATYFSSCTGRAH